MLSLAPMLTHQRIDLLRDEYGIPHIYAQTLEGAAFASGYAQAEDRPLKLIAAAQGKGAKITPILVAFCEGANRRFAEQKRPERISPEKLAPTEIVIGAQFSVPGNRSSNGRPVVAFSTRGAPSDQPYVIDVTLPNGALAGLLAVGQPLPGKATDPKQIAVTSPNPLHQQILEALMARSTHYSVETAMQLLLSTDVYKAEAWQARIAKVDPDNAFARELTGWNRKADSTSLPALSFYLFKLALGAEATALEPPDGLSDARIRAALSKAASRAQTELRFQNGFGAVFRIGTDIKTWPLSGGWIPDAAMFTARDFEYAPGDARSVVNGPNAVIAAEVSQIPTVIASLAMGVSEDPQSPHFDDQARNIFGKGKWITITYPSTKLLDRHVKSRKRLTY